MLHLLRIIFRDLPYSTIVLNDSRSIKPTRVGTLLHAGSLQYYFRDTVSGHAIVLPISNREYKSILVEEDNRRITITITLKGGTHV